MHVYRGRVILSAFAVFFSLLMLPALPAIGGDEQEFIYALHLDNFILSDSIPVYERNRELFLPLGEVASLLNLAVRYHGDGKASGYILDESRTFKLDAVTGALQLQDTRLNFDSGLTIIRKDDLYVAAVAMSRWFPVNITSDKGQQIIKMESREKLPLQQLMERKALSQSLKKATLDDDPSFPDITLPYRLVAPPVIDFATSVDITDKNFDHVQNRLSLIASGDMARLNTTMNLSYNNDSFDRADFIAGRSDSKGKLLGPLQATRFSIGAVQTPALAGISRISNPMYGFLVTNRPITLPTQFSTHDIQGPIPPEWDAELYYNGILIGYHPASMETIYSFTDLPLKVGPNDFRIVLHGPQGETRVEHQRFLLDGTMVQLGKVEYTIGANREIISADQNATGLFLANIGFTKKVSGFIGGLSVADKTGNFTHYVDTGLKGTIGSSFLTLDYVRSSDGGSATLMSLNGYTEGLYIHANQTFLDRFISDKFQYEADPIVSNSSMKLEGSLPLDVRIPFGIESTLEIRKSGDTVPTFIGRLSGEVGGLNVSEQVATHIDKNSITTVGVTQVGTTWKKISLRGQVNYILSPQLSPSMIQISASKDIGTTWQLSGQVNHDPASDNYNFTTGMSKRMGDVGFLVNVRSSTSGEYSISSQLSISAGLHPRTGRIVTDAFPMSSYGGLALFTFIDKNSNGSYDKEEQALEGVRFFLNGGMSLEGTDKDGNLFIKQLPVGMPLDISVATDTIPVPFLVPAAAGYRIEPRSGVMSTIAFNFVPSGEIDGTVQFRSEKGLVPLAGVYIKLCDKHGKIVATTKSEQSGYYFFNRVKGGMYFVRLMEEEVKRLEVYQENAIVLLMPSDGDMLSNNDLIIARPK